jgi:CRP/FNR family cyclic AMP-dependent transcriptional regulator
MKQGVAAKKLSKFDAKTFLSTVDGGRKIAEFSNKQAIFVQDDSSDAVFYIQKGKVRLTVVSKSGKEATIGILNEGDFFGEGRLAGQTLREFSETAVTDCTVMRIDKKCMMEVFHRERALSDIFVAYLLAPTSGMKRIWLTNSSIPVKRVLPGYSYCWLTSVRTESPNL